MDSSEISLPAPPARRRRPAPPAPPGRRARRENPFGERRAAAGAAQRSLRKRIGSALAAIVALVAKFFAAIKGVLLLLPKLKLLTTAGTALVSVAAYSLFLGWTFAVGFVVLLFVHEMGHVIQLRREGHQGERADVHPVPGRGDHREVARRERARGGARGPRRARSSARSARPSAWRSARR